MPTVLSICHGGIWRSETRALIERAQGRASSKVVSGIGAIESTLWQASHFSWKMGAMSFVNVGLSGTPAALANAGIAKPIAHTAPKIPRCLSAFISELLLVVPALRVSVGSTSPITPGKFAFKLAPSGPPVQQSLRVTGTPGAPESASNPVQEQLQYRSFSTARERARARR